MNVNMKKVKALVCVIIVGTYLVGCSEYNNESLNEPVAGDNIEYSGQKLYEKKLSNNVNVAANINIPDVDKKPILNVERQNFDGNKVKEVFLHNEKVETDTKIDEVLGEKIEQTSYDTASGKSLLVRKGTISYSDSNEAYLNNIGTFTDKLVWEKNSLDFMNKDKAINMAIKLCNSLNINVCEKPIKVIALDIENIQNQVSRLKADGTLEMLVQRNGIKEKEITKDDEAYVIEFNTIQKGIILSENGITLQTVDKVIDGSKITVSINKNGIYDFFMEGYSYDVVSVKQENPKTLTIDEGLDKVKDIYKDILTGDSVTVTDIALEYVLNPDYKKLSELELIPTWCFVVEISGVNQKNNEKQSIKNYIYINAVTGKEII